MDQQAQAESACRAAGEERLRRIPAARRPGRPALMRVARSTLPEVLLIEPKVFGDDRGFFFESFNERTFAEKTGLRVHFVQDNHSRSARNVLRGLHYQIRQP